MSLTKTFTVACLVVVAWLAFFLPNSRAAETEARCYEFTLPSPAREAKPELRIELWCYEEVGGKQGGLYIYNADSETVRPEVALLKTRSGRLVHGSLLAGEVKLHNVPADGFNPFPVPFLEPKGKRVKAAPTGTLFQGSRALVLRELQRARPTNEKQLTVKAGKESASATQLPWRGYWWPYLNMPILVPMGKYDAYVQSRGMAGGAVAWENANHGYSGVSWEGHCNGWAASAILRAEPTATIVDAQSGASFRVGDQKGLLAEADYCTNGAFYGYREQYSSGIDPAEFHNALRYFIGQLGKPVAFNFDTDGTVNNQIISGYTMNIQNSANGYVVTTTVRIHGSESGNRDVPGVARSFQHVYQYRLLLDESGRAVTGTWLSASPGFVWVPFTRVRCRHTNANIDHAQIDAILSSM